MDFTNQIIQNLTEKLDKKISSAKSKRYPIRLSTGNYAETYNLLLYNGHYCAKTN